MIIGQESDSARMLKVSSQTGDDLHHCIRSIEKAHQVNVVAPRWSLSGGQSWDIYYHIYYEEVTNMSCPSPYPSEPDYATFLSDYGSYISAASSGTGVPESAIASQWYQEWGIPINNPANQGNYSEGLGIFGQCVNGACGSLPIFCTLSDGVSAYIDQVNYSYNGGSNALPNIYNSPTNWAAAWENGFAGNLVATEIPTDNGCSQTSTSRAWPGVTDIPSGASEQEIQAYHEQAGYAVMEAMGASRWDAGHYWLCGQEYAGEQLTVIAYDSGWYASLDYVS